MKPLQLFSLWLFSLSFSCCTQQKHEEADYESLAQEEDVQEYDPYTQEDNSAIPTLHPYPQEINL